MTSGPATNQNISMSAGNTLTITIPVVDEGGAALVLTGASAQWWMGQVPVPGATPNVLIKKSTAAGTMSISGSSLVIPLLPADTKDLVPISHYYHEAEVTDASGNVATVTIGTFALSDTIIR